MFDKLEGKVCHISTAELRTHGKNTPEGCQNNEVAGIQDLHRRMTELAVKRPWGDPMLPPKGSQENMEPHSWKQRVK